MAFETPVLFLIYNRPETTKQVLERIRENQPKTLFIAADGPRADKTGDVELCRAVRKIVEDGIDWSCEVHTKFRNENLGCGRSVSTSIDWFFSNVERGIILEDDVLASDSFFLFSEELLERFKDDERIMMISGFNHQLDWTSDFSYFFAFYGGVWGWATWRRAWNEYSFILSDWDYIKSQELLQNSLCQDSPAITYREKLVNKVVEGRLDTWDYQWGVARFINSGLTIIPRKSLVSNIGFGEDATHTTNPDSRTNNTPYYDLVFPLKHNRYIVPDRAYDSQFMSSIMGNVKKQLKPQSLMRKIYEKITK